MDPSVAIYLRSTQATIKDTPSASAAKCHVELLRGVLAGEGEDGQLATRVLRQEAGDVQHLAIDHDPAVRLGVVLGNIGKGHAPATAATVCHRRGTCGGRRGSVHLVLVGAAGQLGALHGASQASASDVFQVHILHVRTQHVLGSCLAGHAAEHHAVQQGVATQAVVAVHAAGDLASSIQARDRLVVRADARGVRVDEQAAHAVVNHRRDDGYVERLVLHGIARDDVVEELFAAARLAAGLPDGASNL